MNIFSWSQWVPYKRVVLYETRSLKNWNICFFPFDMKLRQQFKERQRKEVSKHSLAMPLPFQNKRLFTSMLYNFINKTCVYILNEYNLSVVCIFVCSLCIYLLAMAYCWTYAVIKHIKYCGDDLFSFNIIYD